STSSVLAEVATEPSAATLLEVKWQAEGAAPTGAAPSACHDVTERRALRATESQAAKWRLKSPSKVCRKRGIPRASARLTGARRVERGRAGSTAGVAIARSPLGS